MTLVLSGLGFLYLKRFGKNEETFVTAPINSDFEPSYIKLHRAGELRKRGQVLWDQMKNCALCPRECRVDRLNGQKGFCGASGQLEISAYHPHFGEEKPLVGRSGSGTIFLTHCSLRCVFCINWEISQGGQGAPSTIDAMAAMMLALQDQGCLNINAVTPTHYSPHILLALDQAAGQGLWLPLAYNTCGWERLEILKMLDGIMDIYLPDFKYFSSELAVKYSSDARDYPQVTKNSILEMHRQVGVAQSTSSGLINRGLMIRHLVMPSHVDDTKKIIQWIAQNLPKETYLNIMSQYTPTYKAFDYPEISRRLTTQEYDEAVVYAKKMGLTNLDIQGYPF
ncbi:MAG: radical SAM protein [Candidatus Omnitrophota bacterium]